MLTRLTTGEPADRVWFRMADKTYAPANLASAFTKVWANGGSAGADAQTVAQFLLQSQEEATPFCTNKCARWDGRGRNR